MAKKFEPDPDDRRVITTLRICFGDALVKGGTSALIGTLASMFFLNRKRWPIIMCLGIGMGFSWANCQLYLDLRFQMMCGYGGVGNLYTPYCSDCEHPQGRFDDEGRYLNFVLVTTFSCMMLLISSQML